MNNDAYKEGYAAASESRRFEECPYNFTTSGCKATGDQNRFEREFRPKLNAWFAGWKAWLDERGLGFNFQPIRKSPRSASTTPKTL